MVVSLDLSLSAQVDGPFRCGFSAIPVRANLPPKLTPLLTTYRPTMADDGRRVKRINQLFMGESLREVDVSRRPKTSNWRKG